MNKKEIDIRIAEMILGFILVVGTIIGICFVSYIMWTNDLSRITLQLPIETQSMFALGIIGGNMAILVYLAYALIIGLELVFPELFEDKPKKGGHK